MRKVIDISSVLQIWRVAICILALLLLSVEQSWSEPQRYEGVLNEHPIIAFVEFRDDDSVAGLFYKIGDPGLEFSFRGTNPTQGLILIRIGQGKDPVGVAELTKSSSGENIIWKGSIRFADKQTLPLAFSRGRAQDSATSPL